MFDPKLILKNLPNFPGVYRMINTEDVVIYMGKLARCNMSIVALFLFLSLQIFYTSTYAKNACLGKQIKIVAIGDSITQGGKHPDEYTYRLPLSTMLKKAGYDVDFVGTQHSGLDKSFKWPASFDNDHEGFYGRTTLLVAQELKKDFTKLDAISPDIALILLGNNDQKKINLFSAVIQPMKVIIKMLRAKNSKITIFISTLNLDSINFKYIRWHLNLLRWLESSKESKIILVSMHHNWDAQDTFDGIHPSLTGQEKIAKEWLQAINLSCSPT